MLTGFIVCFLMQTYCACFSGYFYFGLKASSKSPSLPVLGTMEDEVDWKPFLLSQLESLLQLWLTLSLNTCSGGSEEGGSDIFMFNASRVPTIPLNQGRDPTTLSVLLNSFDRAESATSLQSQTCVCIYKHNIYPWCVSSIDQQFPDSAGVVPKHLPENMVSGAALSHTDDQHASLRSVLHSHCFPSVCHQQLWKVL